MVLDEVEERSAADSELRCNFVECVYVAEFLVIVCVVHVEHLLAGNQFAGATSTGDLPPQPGHSDAAIAKASRGAHLLV